MCSWCCSNAIEILFPRLSASVQSYPEWILVTNTNQSYSSVNSECPILQLRLAAGVQQTQPYFHSHKQLPVVLLTFIVYVSWIIHSGHKVFKREGPLVSHESRMVFLHPKHISEAVGGEGLLCVHRETSRHTVQQGVYKCSVLSSHSSSCDGWLRCLFCICTAELLGVKIWLPSFLSSLHCNVPFGRGGGGVVIRTLIYCFSHLFPSTGRETVNQTLTHFLQSIQRWPYLCQNWWDSMNTAWHI